jgi:predicted dehydrogenase
MFVPVIGAGSIGCRHHGNLQALGVRTALLPWRGFDADAFRRLGADGAVIATATQVRLDLVRLCTELQIPFYIEKPLAHDVAMVEAILAAAGGGLARRSIVGFMMRYHPAVRLLAETDLSGVYDASFGIGHDVRQWRKGWRFASSYAALPDGGGVLLDLCHELDMALVLLPGAQVAQVDSLGHAAFPGVDFATRIGMTGAGLIGSVAMDYLSPVSFRRIVLRGTGLVADFDLIAGRYRLDEGRGRRDIDLPFERNDMFLAAMRDFLHLVAGRETSGWALLPRLDLVAGNCRAIAAAWAARRFVGQVTGDYA